RLASQLTSWDIDILTEAEESERRQEEFKARSNQFIEALDVDDVIAHLLVTEGFSSIEEVAYVPEKEMLAIEEFDDDLVKELRDRARDVMLTRAIAKEEKLGDAKPAEDLLTMEGMDEALAYELASRGVVTMEDLAEQSVDELLDIPDIDKERAGQLIMTARIPWFEAEESNSEGVS
ncbi:MAG: helix-hairpin-helix domain-containing protein, partial [Proteobacteria bacterium]|nr:helix-hairpin-helix domain-containing protein [Pseudomonadota bacterium]